MLRSVLEYLEGEWSIVYDAPGFFLLVLVLAAGLAFMAIRWRYEGTIQTLRERIKGFKDRIEGKDEQLDRYREELDLFAGNDSESGSAYSRLSDEELKRRTLMLVDQLRNFVEQKKREEQESLYERWAKTGEYETESRKQEIWYQSVADLSQKSLKMQAQYDQNFRVEAILLRDELLARLPEQSKEKRSDHINRMYEHPTNFFGYTEVADDLEKLSRSLPI